ELALLILGDLDPYTPTITPRASPPPDVRRARQRFTLTLALLKLTKLSSAFI
ncbi:MAG: hypothetical protein K0S70_3692, partial [Microbacterium sp.]|nr:hypothetical protein [Microbacterium sp.]